MFYNLFCWQFTNVCNKLERLSQAGLSNLIKCFRARPGAYPRVEHLKGSSLVQALAFFHKHQTRQERLARDKHLLRTFINYWCKMFYNIGPRTQPYLLVMLAGKNMNVNQHLKLLFESSNEFCVFAPFLKTSRVAFGITKDYLPI